jgi:hypothetical protein
MSSSPSVTIWNRLEPRPRTANLDGSLAAEIRDPAWFLTRQWQVGEFHGEDAGSPAFAQYGITTAKMASWGAVGPGAPAPTPLVPGVPLERQALAEPSYAPSLTVRAELGQTFVGLLAARLGGDQVSAKRIADALRAKDGYALAAPHEEQFDPFDGGTTRFLLVCAGRVLDGSALLALAASLAGTGTFPTGVVQNGTEETAVRDALTDLVKWVGDIYGKLDVADPPTWRPDLIEYGMQVVSDTPDNRQATMVGTPDELGELHWSSFDVTGAAGAAAQAPQSATVTIIPTHVRFRGMPAQRFWDFEESELSFADIAPDKRDLVKALCADFMLVHGVDWFAFPIDVEGGQVVRLDNLVVTDVFGGRTLVERADKGVVPGRTRWTMFSSTQTGAGAPASGLSEFFVVPPSAGPSLVAGPTVEEVRFARDEMANMAFGIERVTMSPIGEPRQGNERDAAVDVRTPFEPPPSDDQTSPLRYLIESKIPVQYIPLLGVKKTTDPNDPSIVLEKATILRPITINDNPSYATVPAVGRILNPQAIPVGTNYQILEEQVPRAGVTVRRTIYRARWRDGSTHLWIARRKQTGAGEAQAGLRFDAALPVER